VLLKGVRDMYANNITMSRQWLQVDAGLFKKIGEVTNDKNHATVF
jgi:hypothetical protein